MKRPRPWKNRLAPFMLVAALCQAPVAAQPYQNPVIPFTEAEIADPFVLKHNGEYYMYASGDPIVVYHSRDLVNWKRVGPALNSTPGSWNEADVWAPEVIYRNGKFYMYYTASRKGADWRVGEMARRVGVAVSDSPEGPFIDSGKPVTPTWAIDGHVYTDKTGQDWLFYSFLQEPTHPGAGIAVDRLVSFDKVAGTPTVCLQGSEDWEDKDGDPHNGSLRYTNEGPTVIERDGTLYLFYSGGSWDRPTYAVSYATASSPLGPWKKALPPVLRATPLVDGPGHNALVKAPNGLDDIHFYHARKQPYLDPWNRAPFADRLLWDGDRPFVAQPSLGVKAAPDKATFSDYFDIAGKPDDGWVAGDGGFEVAGGVLKGTGSRAALSLAQEPEGPYVFEANIKLMNDSRAGIQLGEQIVILDGQNRVLRTNEKVLHGFSKEFRTNAFHQLVVVDDGSKVKVFLDGVQRGELAGGAVGSSPALWIESGAAEFDGVALGSGYQESFRQAVVPAGWTGEGTFTPTLEGWLQTGQGLAWRVKGPFRSRYEFSATLLPRDTAAPQVAKAGLTDGKWHAGIVAARGSSGDLLLAGYDKGIWPYARFRVWEVKGGKAGSPVEVGLPRGFRYDSPHTIRVERNGDDFTFFMDGQEILASRFAVGDAQAGVFTQNISAAFSAATYKELVSGGNLLLDGSFETEQWDGLLPAHGNPWSLTGQVRPNESSAHGGVRRLLFGEGQGRAEQTVKLAPGKYRLHAFAIGEAGQLGLSAGKVSRSVPVKGSWGANSLDFEIGAAADVPIALVATVNAQGYLAVDDVWLERR